LGRDLELTVNFQLLFPPPLKASATHSRGNDKKRAGMTSEVLVIYYWTTPPCSAFAKATARQARGNSFFASGETSKGNKKMKKEDGDGNGKV